ncbi:MAG: mevalonate kinase [Candidatus Undinarchaeales archaeon]
MVKVSAPGKLILFGEHAVVYGEAAIATAVNKRAFVTAEKFGEPRIIVESSKFDEPIHSDLKEETDNPVVKSAQETLKFLNKNSGVKLNISSRIPISVGMGSSASTVTAASSSILSLFDSSKNERGAVAKIAYEAEKATHGKYSGINTAVTTLGGTILFQKGKVEQVRTEPLNVIVGNSGIKKDTKKIVDEIRSKVEDPRVAYNIFTIGSIVRKAKKAIHENNLPELGRLMDKNHYYLRELGVSSRRLENLVEAAREAGAYGAKITGSGGGGCIIALAEDPDPVIDALKEKGAEAFMVKTHQGGVRDEKTPESFQ